MRRAILIGLGLLLLGAHVAGDNVLPSGNNLGEVGDYSIPDVFGAGNFRQVDAGTVNAQTLVLSGTTVTAQNDGFLTIYDPETALTTGDIWVAGDSFKSAATIQSCEAIVGVAGGGTGNTTTKLTSAASGGGTAFCTCTIPANSAVGATVACTVNTAAVPAATTPHYGATSNATTANQPHNFVAHYSQP